MSERIYVNDVVMVVRLKPCGCGTLGKIYTVRGIKAGAEKTSCNHCGKAFLTGETSAIMDTDAQISIYRLKKLPPLTETERETAGEGVKA